jgi:hypothetical protein
MSINNREDADKYYNQINLLVDDYIEKYKVRPSSLKRYLKPGSKNRNRFLKKNNLSDINGVDVVLSDVINDRDSMEKDGIYTFESYYYFQSDKFKIDSLKQCLYKGIDKADIKSEKVLADYFDVNLGDIDIIDSDKHTFKIKDWNNDDWIVCIYSDEEVDIIKENIVEYFCEISKSKEIEIMDGLKISISELLNNDKLKEILDEKVNKNRLKDLICQSLGDDWSFESFSKNHFIWIS